MVLVLTCVLIRSTAAMVNSNPEAWCLDILLSSFKKWKNIELLYHFSWHFPTGKIKKNSNFSWTFQSASNLWDQFLVYSFKGFGFSIPVVQSEMELLYLTFDPGVHLLHHRTCCDWGPALWPHSRPEKKENVGLKLIVKFRCFSIHLLGYSHEKCVGAQNTLLPHGFNSFVVQTFKASEKYLAAESSKSFPKGRRGH